MRSDRSENARDFRPLHRRLWAVRWGVVSAGRALPIPRYRPNIPPMDQTTDPRPTKRCPICGKPVVTRFRPFCSKRCADVDLNRWLSGRYAVPVVEEDASAPGKREDESS